jgi:hypothetical protein
LDRVGVDAFRVEDAGDVGLPLRHLHHRRLVLEDAQHGLDIEFSQEDLAREWPHPGCEVERDAVKQEANTGLSADLGGGAAGPVFSVRRKAPVSDRELRSWYQNRVSELTAGGVTSSSEQDWEAAKREFTGRVTRARVRAIREEMTPEQWKKQGRGSALRGS